MHISFISDSKNDARATESIAETVEHFGHNTSIVNSSEAQRLLRRTPRHRRNSLAFVARRTSPDSLLVIQAAAKSGSLTINSAESTRRAWNRSAQVSTIHRSGIAQPAVKVVHPTRCSIENAHSGLRFPIVTKSAFNGRGVARLAYDVHELQRELVSRLRADPLVVIQEYVENSGIDFKTYVAGSFQTVRTRQTTLNVAFSQAIRVNGPATVEIAKIVNSIRDAFGLVVFGIDLIATSFGPQVVDVNESPSFYGVHGSAQIIGSAIVHRAFEWES